jgi:hypothetical protein
VAAHSCCGKGSFAAGVTGAYDGYVKIDHGNKLEFVMKRLNEEREKVFFPQA